MSIGRKGKASLDFEMEHLPMTFLEKRLFLVSSGYDEISPLLPTLENGYPCKNPLLAFGKNHSDARGCTQRLDSF